MAPRTQTGAKLTRESTGHGLANGSQPGPSPLLNRIVALTDEEFQDVLLVASCVRDILPVSKFREAYLDSREFGLPHNKALASLVTVEEPRTIQTVQSPMEFKEAEEWPQAVSKAFLRRGSRKPVYEPGTRRVVDQESGDILATGVTRAQAAKLWVWDEEPPSGTWELS